MVNCCFVVARVFGAGVLVLGVPERALPLLCASTRGQRIWNLIATGKKRYFRWRPGAASPGWRAYFPMDCSVATLHDLDVRDRRTGQVTRLRHTVDAYMYRDGQVTLRICSPVLLLHLVQKLAPVVSDPFLDHVPFHISAKTL